MKGIDKKFKLLALASNITINEINPRSKKYNDKFPPPEMIAGLIKSKYEGKISHYQLRQVLDKFYEEN